MEAEIIAKYPVELLACPEHRDEHLKKMSAFGSSDAL
jgi:hypothetical protein